MTKRALKKLTDTQRDALQGYQNFYNLAKENNNIVDSTAFKNKILGYASALRDCGQITERERMSIVIYYTL